MIYLFTLFLNAAIDRLSIIWKSNLTDKMKRSFFQTAVVSILLLNIEQVLAATPHKAPTIRPHASHHENYPS